MRPLAVIAARLSHRATPRLRAGSATWQNRTQAANGDGKSGPNTNEWQRDNASVSTDCRISDRLACLCIIYFYGWTKILHELGILFCLSEEMSQISGCQRIQRSSDPEMTRYSGFYNQWPKISFEHDYSTQERLAMVSPLSESLDMEWQGRRRIRLFCCNARNS